MNRDQIDLSQKYDQAKEKWEKEKMEYQRLCQWYANSIRYQLGSVFTESLKHPHKFIVLPYRVFKLFQKYHRDSQEVHDIESGMQRTVSDHEMNWMEEKTLLRILFVMMEGNGGSVKTNEDLMQYLSINGYQVYLLNGNRKSMHLYRCQNDELRLLQNFEIRQPWEITHLYQEEYKEIYSEVLNHLQIDIVHIRHFYYHTFDIVTAAKELSLPVLLSFHDFYCICPTTNMINDKGSFCQGDCYERKKKCYISPANVRIPGNIQKWVDQVWRREVRKIMKEVCGCITTSQYAADFIMHFYAESISKLHIIEHGRNFSYPREFVGTYPGKQGKIKILLVGNIDHCKGEGYIRKLLKIDKEKRIEWHCIGMITEKLKPQMQYYGKYIREDFYLYVRKIKPSYIGIFSIWPETYCHVLTEAWSCGIPCVVSDIGTLHERAVKGGAILADLDAPKDVYQKILTISYDEALYRHLCQEVQNQNIRSISEMGDDYRLIYQSILRKSREGIM
jgi:glycosyltransferase involved in cell wall biosynthesis